jgi:hypothetical protein
MVRRSAWVLNFDADEELAKPSGYVPKPSTLARAAALTAKLGELVRAGDALVDEGARLSSPDGVSAGSGPDVGSPPSADAPSYVGRAFCPTPRALALLIRAGVRPAKAPPAAVLRRVNHRRFAFELGLDVPGAAFAASASDVETLVRGATPSGFWLLKRPHGFAGRERRRVPNGVLDGPSRVWTLASFDGMIDDPGVAVVPWVEVAADFALHGFIPRAAPPLLGLPTIQVCDRGGAWRRSRRAAPGEISPSEREHLFAAAHAAAAALRVAGYFGPFGIDAFRWKGASGKSRLCACCDLNARYTMGWASGMGDTRPDLDAAHSAE